MDQPTVSAKTDRRSFLQTSGVAVIGATLASSLVFPVKGFARNTDTLKIGLIGCGGRGTGAAMQALKADPNVVLTAMADIFPDHLQLALEGFAAEFPDRVKVPKENQFIGFDAYKQLIASGVDVVLLTTPPSFRPDHLVEAVNAGKHVFCEKPVAIDIPGIKKVIAAAAMAKQKNLNLVSGFCFRYDLPKRAIYKRILAGDLGEIKTISTVRNGGELWSKPRKADWGDMEYKLRNWMYYNWLSGDFIAEMMVHSLDLMSWAMGDRLPMSVTGTGGRQSRTQEIYGNVYDHFAIEYDYGNSVTGFHMSRQQEGCSNANKVQVSGSLGNAVIDLGRDVHEVSGKNKWMYKGPKNNMYQTQHDELFASIRKGKPMNDAKFMCNSTLLGIWSRMAAYSGQTITREEVMNSTESLSPAADQFSWDLSWPGKEIAKPGITKSF